MLTGLNEAFVIDAITRDRLIAEDPGSAEIIKPYLAGRDIKRYQRPQAEKFMILFKNGQTVKWLGQKLPESEALHKMQELYPSLMQHLMTFEKKAKARYDQGQYWWELRACDYYEEFERPKIMLPDISLKAECLFDNSDSYCINTAYIIPTEEIALLGILNSSVVHFFYSNITSSVRGGYLRFIRQYLEQIPIPDMFQSRSDEIKTLVEKIIEAKKGKSTKNEIQFENHIDRLVYELYGLTDEEVEIVERG